jgi:hypothetical protein
VGSKRHILPLPGTWLEGGRHERRGSCSMRAALAARGPKEPMITLYQFEVSPFCDKIRRVLHWKKQPYEVHEVSLWQALTQLRRLNPAGKLPCLVHDGRFVFVCW